MDICRRFRCMWYRFCSSYCSFILKADRFLGSRAFNLATRLLAGYHSHIQLKSQAEREETDPTPAGVERKRRRGGEGEENERRERERSSLRTRRSSLTSSTLLYVLGSKWVDYSSDRPLLCGMRLREQLALKMKYCKTLCYTAQRKRRLAAMSMINQNHRVEREILRVSCCWSTVIRWRDRG